MWDKFYINNKLKQLPQSPGCYLMKNVDNVIIYVGKAKNLRNRVKSYFKQAHNGKTQYLVNDISDFETIVTNTNKEALLLEMSLIKEHLPKYNIKLKDGTMYPYLKITNEKDPQLIICNQIEKDGALYFGPYPNVGAATKTQQLLQKIFPLRRCPKHEKRACFYYHLDQCIGCCDHPISKETYQETITHIQQFLNGEVSHIKKQLKEKMIIASEKLDFEQAADYRNQIEYVETTVERQHILSKEYTNHDVFGFYEQNGLLSIQVFLLRQNSIIKREAYLTTSYNDISDELLSYIVQFYDNPNHLLPKEIIVPNNIDHLLLEETLHTKIVMPQRGKKKSLLDLAIKNSQIALNEHMHLEKITHEKTIDATKQLADCLGIKQAYRIESFDHSNIQGAYPVSGMVVFIDGKPAKKEYRKFKVKTVIGSNELATTQEIIYRRYSRLLAENGVLPDLILMDGGDIQVNATKSILTTLGLSIPVAGMVKNDKHSSDHLIFGDPLDSIPLAKNTPAFKLIQRIQDEVHRFAITFHKQLHSKHSLSSQLDSIHGVGEKTRKKLLMHYQTYDDIKKTTLDDLLAIPIAKSIAKEIINHFENKK